MKRISLLLTCLVLFCGWMTAQNDKITFNETNHDFGNVGERDGNVTFDFILKNNGNDPVVIANVQASCGCTTPIWTREPIEKGKTGTISVTYSPLGRVGPIDKTITVFTNQNAPLYLKITGNVVQGSIAKKALTPQEAYPIAMGNYLLKTKDLMYGRIGMGESKTIKLEVYNNSDKPVTQKASKLPKYMSVAFNPATIPAKTAGTIDVTMHVQENLYGNLSGNIALLINGVQQSFPYSATVLDDFSVWTATKKTNAGKINVGTSEINFGNFTTGVTRTLKISNSGKSVLNIRNIQSSNPSVTVSKSHFAINPGEIGETKVNVDTKKVQSRLQSTLSIFTDDPNMPVYEVTVVGNNK